MFIIYIYYCYIFSIIVFSQTEESYVVKRMKRFCVICILQLLGFNSNEENLAITLQRDITAGSR